MPPYVIALIFGALGLAAAWGIQRDLVTGVSNDEWRRYSLGQNPFAYMLAVFAKIFVLFFCAGEVLHAFGLVGDPVVAIRTALPFLPRKY